MSNPQADEQVALVDESGVVVGQAPRSQVRAQNLRHMATGVLVRNSYGLVYVHRRTDTKDVFPGAYDCVSGGVVLAGESPRVAAERELAEELGVSGVPLRPLLTAEYADEHTRYLAHVYQATWDGPIVHQPEEVASGSWMTIEELLRRLHDPGWPFVPDSTLLVQQVLGDLAHNTVLIDAGWDSRAWLVEGTWLDREPRRAAVADRLRTETRLMPWLAARLSVELPVPRVIQDGPLRVRHRYVNGAPLERGDGHVAVEIATALRTLHAQPVAEAVALGVPDAATSCTALSAELSRFKDEVLPLLDVRHREVGLALLEQVAEAPFDSLVHGDLGPEHILVRDGSKVGIIDWTDAHIGDAALDLAWLLYGTEPGFAAAIRQAYAPSPDLLRRSLAWHRLGPWYEVVYGIDEHRPELVASGLDGVNNRLHQVGPQPWRSVG
jgi:aminoglycoside phosphotransferase (APT) family kinase protein/isopentenyldiphosphate isomerase